MVMELRAGKYTYSGTFLVSLGLLMFEILLTRIYNVTTMYHFTFVAISLAMFGITVGSLIVYLVPSYFTVERTKYHLSLTGLLMAGSMVLSLVTFLSIPMIPDISFQAAYSMFLTYLVLSVPFILGGMCICLALTRFPAQVGRIYAADLAGAAGGCLLSIYFLQVTDGPSAIVIAAFLACVGALMFAADGLPERFAKVVAVCTLLIGFAGIGNGILAVMQIPVLKVTWLMGELDPQGLYEKWNSFSRIKVIGNPDAPSVIQSMGLSPVYPRNQQLRRLLVRIDYTSGTDLLNFRGDLKEFEFLKWDVGNLAHHIRPGGKVLAIGVGGGIDALSALVFGQKKVVGVDMNGNILDVVNRDFRDFTGRMDRIPGVSFVHDEARSYIARQDESFDIIQGRAIERPEATLGGAFVLSENVLYTVEAWKTMLERLTPQGVLTFMRYHEKSMPYHLLRMVSLATTALAETGVTDPRKHIIIARLPFVPGVSTGSDASPMASILVCKSPFSDQDAATVSQLCKKMGFEPVLTPHFAVDPSFEKLATIEGAKKAADFFPSLDVSAPTDDKPFFYNLLKFEHVFKPESWRPDRVEAGLKGLFALAALLATVTVLTVLCVVVPLLVKGRGAHMKGSLPFFVFFAAIGLGFMLIEISQVQRLGIFLGHPTYSLSVVLFSLLLSCGAGSYLTEMRALAGGGRSVIVPMIVLLLVLALFAVVSPPLMANFRHASNLERMCLTAGMLACIGLFMGMAVPLGIRLASAVTPGLTVWFWGMNGAMSVCGSVLAYAVCLFWGISAALWTGIACYGVALIAFVCAAAKGSGSSNQALGT